MELNEANCILNNTNDTSRKDEGDGYMGNSDVFDNNERNNSQDDQSISSDSDLSENFVDSKYDVSDDDTSFDFNINEKVE